MHPFALRGTAQPSNTALDSDTRMPAPLTNGGATPSPVTVESSKNHGYRTWRRDVRSSKI